MWKLAGVGCVGVQMCGMCRDVCVDVWRCGVCARVWVVAMWRLADVG